jgi:lysozyme family protein
MYNSKKKTAYKYKKPTPYNKTLKDNMDSLREYDVKFKENVKQGVENIKALIPKGSERTNESEQRYRQLLNSLDNKYANKFGRLAQSIKEMRAQDDDKDKRFANAIENLGGENSMLKKSFLDSQKKTQLAMRRMLGMLQEQRENGINTRDNNGGYEPNNTSTTGTSYNGAPVEFNLSGYSKQLNPKNSTTNDANTNGGTNSINNNNSSRTEVRTELARFNTFLPAIQLAEGGYQENPDDKGNYNSKNELVGTNYGISAALYEDILGRPPTKEDMKNLTEKQASDIFYKKFYIPSNVGYIQNDNIAKTILDHSINAGIKGGAIVAQRALNALGYNVPVTGEITPGDETLKGINEVDPAKFFNEYNKQRRLWYRSLSDYAIFGRGWEKRVDRMIYK